MLDQAGNQVLKMDKRTAYNPTDGKSYVMNNTNRMLVSTEDSVKSAAEYISIRNIKFLGLNDGGALYNFRTNMVNAILENVCFYISDQASKKANEEWNKTKEASKIRVMLNFDVTDMRKLIWKLGAKVVH